MDSSNVFTPSGSTVSFSSQCPREVFHSSGTLHSLDNLDLDSFSFRWDLGLDCEDEDESISDYGTVLHAGEPVLSTPLTTATGLSAVEEITEGGLTDSRTTSAVDRLSLSMPPSDNELGLLPSHGRKDLHVTKNSKNILGRLREAITSDRLTSRLSIPWPLLAPTPPVVKARVNSSEKRTAISHPRPRNKLRKKTRPSIAITLAVGPTSSFSLAQPQVRLSQPLPRSLKTLQTNPNSASPVAGLPSAKSFLSFQLPPVFSRARSKALQKSTYRPPNDMGVINSTPAMNRPGVGPSGFRTDKPAESNDERTALVDNNGIGNFPTPVRTTSYRNRRALPREETPAHGRPDRMSTPWELGLRFGQDLGLKACKLCRMRGGS